MIELQARLQYIGYYTGQVDGVFGWSTYWAVRNFQHDFGLQVDGLVGDEMKKKLRETTWFDKAYVHGKIERGEKWGFHGPTPGQERMCLLQDKGILVSSDKYVLMTKERQAPQGKLKQAPNRPRS